MQSAQPQQDPAQAQAPAQQATPRRPLEVFFCMVDATHIQSNVLDQNGQRPPGVQYELFYNGFEYLVQIDGPF